MKPDACEANPPPPREPRACEPEPRFLVSCPRVLRTVFNMFRFLVFAMPPPTR